MSNVISLFSEENSEAGQEALLNDLKSDPQKSELVHIEWDGKSVKSFKEKKKIFVFNSEFIVNHVYNGTQSNIRLFKAGIVTQEQLSNPEIKNLTNQLEDKKSEFLAINEEKENLTKLAESIRLNLSKHWNESMPNSRMPSNLNLENRPVQISSETEEALEEKLKDSFRCYNLSKNQAGLQADIENLSALALQRIHELKNYSTLLLANVSTDAREKIKIKIDELRKVELKHISHQNWFEDGVKLLRSSPKKLQCPLCESKIDNLDSLLSAYDAYFNK